MTDETPKKKTTKKAESGEAGEVKPKAKKAERVAEGDSEAILKVLKTRNITKYIQSISFFRHQKAILYI